jgi:hypothetical protein
MAAHAADAAAATAAAADLQSSRRWPSARRTMHALALNDQGD